MMVHDVHHRPSSFDASSSSSTGLAHRTDSSSSSSTHSAQDDRSRRRRPSGHGTSSFGRTSREGSFGSATSGGFGGSGAGWATGEPTSSARPSSNSSFPTFSPAASSRPTHSQTSSYDASSTSTRLAGEESAHRPGPSSFNPSASTSASSRSPSNPSRASISTSHSGSHSSNSSSSHLPSSPYAPSSTSSTSTARPSSPSARHPPPPSSDVSMQDDVRRASTTPDIPPPSALPPTPTDSSQTHLDLVTYPSTELVKLLAALLQQIASANDALRKEEGEDGKAKSEDGHESTSLSSGGQGLGEESHEEQDSEDARPMSRPPSLESTSSAASNQSDAPPRTPSDPLAPVPAANTPRTSFEASSSSPHPTTFPSSSSSTTLSRHTSHSSNPSQTTHVASPAPTLVPPKHLTASLNAFKSTSSSLCFHARNVPGINIEVYLQRILKYCPASNEVFLSLLVYFDRMSKLSLEVSGKSFAIDSFNVHRLVIAGVTVASKFFSDVFYTNSRYAKVGGLPQSELNQLELQFLLLNDFSLAIPLEEMQRYGDQLLLYSQNASTE